MLSNSKQTMYLYVYYKIIKWQLKLTGAALTMASHIFSTATVHMLCKMVKLYIKA